MNREIKFKGQHIESKEWLYGSLYDDGGEDYILPNNLASALDYEDYQVNQNTIGQFTGLYDRNGKEIYEGDIVALPSQDIAFGIVTWHDNGYFFIDNSNGEWRFFGNDFRPLGEFMNLSDDHKVKVIGNIHDNLDLMK